MCDLGLKPRCFLRTTKIKKNNFAFVVLETWRVDFTVKYVFFFPFWCFFCTYCAFCNESHLFVARLQRVRLLLPPVGFSLTWPMKTAVARQPSPGGAAPPPAEPLWPPGCVWACSVGWWRPAADRSTSGGCWGQTQKHKKSLFNPRFCKNLQSFHLWICKVKSETGLGYLP